MIAALRTLRLTTRLLVVLLSLLALSIAGTLLSIWSLRQADHHFDRIRLAQQSYAAHLSLESHTYQLFKQYGDELILGERDPQPSRSSLIDDTRADIALIRKIIGKEIELVGGEEIEELNYLARIERRLEVLVERLDRAVKDSGETTVSSNWLELSKILDEDIDGDFRSLIGTALEEERGELESTEIEVRRQFTRYRSLAVLYLLAALGVAAFGLWFLRRKFTDRASRLLDGVRRFNDGNMAHRIELDGRDEITDIADTFDTLAEHVMEKTEQLASENRELDQTVRDRNRQLEQLLEDARRSEANRRRLLADVSHELRTPLTVIKGEADIALRGAEKSTDAYQEALQRTRDAAGHTARLVDDLLFVARSESGETRLRIDKLDLGELLRDVCETFDADVEFTDTVDEASLRADATRLRQVVLVLLHNARQHGGQQVWLHLDRATGGYRIAVEDDGPGMSDTDKEQAFERFFRGSNAAERYQEGLGLGLPVARAIMRAHGGEINLEDRESGGLVVSVIVPERPPLQAVS